MPLLKKSALSAPTRDRSQTYVLIELMSIEVKMVRKVPIFFCYNSDNDFSLENTKEGTNEVHKRPSVLTSKRGIDSGILCQPRQRDLLGRET
jgi:hypothetical protein